VTKNSIIFWDVMGVVWKKIPDVLQENTVSVFRVEE
jgi:hypothetical protein